MSLEATTFWAKTTPEGLPGISVRDHCMIVGCVAEAMISLLPRSVQDLIPPGTVTLAALHDIGKLTIGFQAKCPKWFSGAALPPCNNGNIALSETDHARVTQHFLEELEEFRTARLWAVAAGAHHGRPKGRRARLSAPEELAEWFEERRRELLVDLRNIFGQLPKTPPKRDLTNSYSDLWLVAGLISVADWIGSNETWFPSESGLTLEEARRRSGKALLEIGWPGGILRSTSFSASFSRRPGDEFSPNPLQRAVAEASAEPGLIIVEGPMGCGKTEAALFAAQQLISSGKHQGLYFALPTQVTSNRIHRRIGKFLQKTLADKAALRLVHGNAWLEDDFDLRLSPGGPAGSEESKSDRSDSVHEARSWFASAKQALLATYGVGTVDQALQGVVAVKHFFVRRFALAGKVVILDEVHSYDIYTGTLITALARELINLQCTVIVLSATLTHARRRELLDAAGMTEQDAAGAYPLVTFGPRGSASRNIRPGWISDKSVVVRAETISEEDTVAELTRRAEAGQHVLWIRNTVIEAQGAYREICSFVREGSVQAGLLHSRFPFQRREELEAEWLEKLGPERGASACGSILIATQVVEQSVDIDLDFIVSDLAPTDMLLQRIGRLWRHARTGRAAEYPEFWIRVPQINMEGEARGIKSAFGRSGRVYAPYVLARTADVWRERRKVEIPGDIRCVLEATYADPSGDEPEGLRELHRELEAKKRELASNAEAAMLVLGRPMSSDEEHVLTRRAGAPTTPVLLVRAVASGGDGSAVVHGLDGLKLHIDAYEWRRAAARFVYRWIVRAPRWMVPEDATCPAWLTLHASNQARVAVVADDGRCYFGGTPSQMIYQPDIGLFADRLKQHIPKPEDDDEFDY